MADLRDGPRSSPAAHRYHALGDGPRATDTAANDSRHIEHQELIMLRTLPAPTNPKQLLPPIRSMLASIARAYRMRNAQLRKLRLTQAAVMVKGVGLPLPHPETLLFSPYQALVEAAETLTPEDIATAYRLVGALYGARFPDPAEVIAADLLKARLRAATPHDLLVLANGCTATVEPLPPKAQGFVRARYHHPTDRGWDDHVGDWTMDGAKECPNQWPEGSNVVRVVRQVSKDLADQLRAALSRLHAARSADDLRHADVLLVLDHVAELEVTVKKLEHEAKVR